jgi:WD40 repeat protein
VAGLSGTIRLYDVSTGNPAAELTGHKRNVLTLAFASAGDRLASTSEDGTTRIWNARPDLPRRVLEGGAVYCGVAFSPDAKMVAAILADSATHALWDARTGRCLATWRDGGQMAWGIGFAHAGRSVVTLGRDGALRFWDTRTRRALPALRTGVAAPAQVLVSGNGALAVLEAATGEFSAWDLRSRRRLGGLPRPTNLNNPAYLAALSPDGTLLAVALGNSIGLWQVPTFERKMSLSLGGQATETLEFSLDGSRLVASDGLGRVHLWEVRSGQEFELLSEQKGRVEAAGISPDGRLVATIALSDRFIRLWSTEDHAQIAALPGGSGPLRGRRFVAFSPDGSILGVTITWGAVYLWRAAPSAAPR